MRESPVSLQLTDPVNAIYDAEAGAIVPAHKDGAGVVHRAHSAAEMGFSKPSVSVAMKNLREQECITMGEDGLISLTEKGRKIAESVYERHTLFTQWLVSLGVDAATAAQDACRIEHVLSKETFEAIKRHVESGFSSRP